MTQQTDVTDSARGLYSELAQDPDLGELVDLFVSELRDRIDALQEAFEKSDFELLARLAHQLKGAAGSYGFAPLTPALRELEVEAREAHSTADIEQTLAEVRSLCQRVRSGVPG